MPYVFVRACGAIGDGESLYCDHGEAYWKKYSAPVARILHISRLAKNFITRVGEE